MKQFNQLATSMLLISALTALPAIAQSTQHSTTLKNGKLETVSLDKNITSTIDRLAKDNEQWFTYRVKMEANNGMPCCYSNVRGNAYHSSSVCDLGTRGQSSGNIHVDGSRVQGDDLNSATLDIYFKYKDQQAEDIFYVGSDCPVDANDKIVYQLQAISQAQSVAFLSQFTSPPDGTINRRMTHGALSAIALHQGQEAQDALDKASKDSDKKIRLDAIFWLGEARNQAGYQSLVKLLADPNTDDKSQRQAVFALSENKYEKAMDKLVALASTDGDDEIQAEAIFWLAESDKQKAAKIIDDVLNNSHSKKVREKAIFSLSEINTDQSWQQLIYIAQNSKDNHDREAAIFWLSQNHGRDASTILLTIAQNDPAKSIREKAVFALSQLPADLATSSLLNVLKTTDDRATKKQALFWLGQSDDPKAIAAIEQLLASATD